jgi:hypothetical protein
VLVLVLQQVLALMLLMVLGWEQQWGALTRQKHQLGPRQRRQEKEQ